MTCDHCRQREALPDRDLCAVRDAQPVRLSYVPGVHLLYGGRYQGAGRYSIALCGFAGVAQLVNDAVDCSACQREQEKRT